MSAHILNLMYHIQPLHRPTKDGVLIVQPRLPKSSR